MNKFLKILVSSIYPNRCICCGEIIDEDAFICDKCDSHIERNDIKNIVLIAVLKRMSALVSLTFIVFRLLFLFLKMRLMLKRRIMLTNFIKSKIIASFLQMNLAM